MSKTVMIKKVASYMYIRRNPSPLPPWHISGYGA